YPRIVATRTFACPSGGVLNSEVEPPMCVFTNQCPEAGTIGPELFYIAGWRTGPASGAPSAGGTSSIPSSICSGQCVLNVTTGATAVRTTPAENGYYPVDGYAFTAYSGATCSGQFQVENAPPP